MNVPSLFWTQLFGCWAMILIVAGIWWVANNWKHPFVMSRKPPKQSFPPWTVIQSGDRYTYTWDEGDPHWMNWSTRELAEKEMMAMKQFVEKQKIPWVVDSDEPAKHPVKVDVTSFRDIKLLS